MIDKDLVRSKINAIKKYYGRLEPILKKDARVIIDDYLLLHTLERLFQLIVDTALEINTHFIAELKLTVPEDYQNTFIVLGENRIFPMEFMGKIAGSVGLRNLVVHKYGKVDEKRMVDDVKQNISQYLEYLKYVERYLEAHG